MLDRIDLVMHISPRTKALFPYTTLFRSLAEHLRENWRTGLGLEDAAKLAIGTLARSEKEERRKIPVSQIEAAVLDRAKADRKSTRLNYSHVAISYAVFCLKKKKIQ